MAYITEACSLYGLGYTYAQNVGVLSRGDITASASQFSEKISVRQEDDKDLLFVCSVRNKNVKNTLNCFEINDVQKPTAWKAQHGYSEIA